MSIIQLHRQAVAEQLQSDRDIGHQLPRSGMPATGPEKKADVVKQALLAALIKLKQLHSREKKVELKRQLIDEYEGQAMAWVDSNSNAQSDVFVYWMFWQFDVGNVSNGLKWADIAIERGQKTPASMDMKADIVTFVARSVFEHMGTENEDTEAFATVYGRIASGEWDVPDKLHVDYLKHRSDSFEEAGDLSAAVDALEKALKLGGTVKTRLDKLKASVQAG